MNDTLTSYATKAVLDTDGDIEGATQMFLATLRDSNPDLYEEKARASLRMWAQDVIRRTRGHVRSVLIERGVERAPKVFQRVDANTLQQRAVTWLNWSIGSIQIGNATRAHLMLAAEKYRRDADTYTRRAKWLEAIAARLEDDETPVRNVLTADEVGAIAAECGVTEQ